MNPRPQQGRHLVIGLGLAVIIATGLVLFVGLTRQVMGSVRDALLSDFRRLTGYEISYDSISPSFFRFFEIRNLSVRSLDSEQRTVARVETLRVHYRFFDLFLLKDKIRAVEKIEAERGVFHMDAEKDASLLSFMEGVLKDPGSEYRLSPRFALTGRNITVTYQQQSSRWSLKDIFATITSGNDSLSFTLHGRGEAGTAREPFQAEYSTGLDVAGRVDKTFEALDAEVAVAAFRTGDIILQDQQFLIRLKNGMVDLTKVQDRSPLDLSVSFDAETKELTAEILAADLHPGEIFSFTDNLASLRPLLAGSVTAAGSLRYRTEINDLDFTLAFSSRLPESISTVAFGIDATISGTEDRIDFTPVTLTSKLGNVEFTGNVVYRNLLPEGYLRFTNVKTSVTDDINADFSIARGDRGVTVTGDRILIGTTGFRSFVLDVYPRPQNATFILTAALDLPVRDHHLNLKGEIAYAEKYGLSLEGDLSMIPANILYRMITATDTHAPSLDAVLSGIMLSSRCRLTTDFNTFSFSSPALSVQDGVNPANRIVFDLTADQHGLSLTRIHGVWADYRLEGNLSLAQLNNAELVFDSGFSVNGESYALAGRSVPGAGLMVTGTHDLSFLIVPRREGGRYVSLQATRLPVPIGGKTVYATLDWIGSISGRGKLELVSRQTLFTGIPALLPGMKNASADLRFSLSNEHLILSRLVVRDAVSTLVGNGAFDVAASPAATLDGWLYLADENGFERYQGLLSAGSEQQRLDLSFKNSPVARLGEVGVRGGLSGTVAMRGPFSDPTVDFDIFLERGRLNAETIELHTRGTVSRSGLMVESLQGAYGKDLRLTAGRGGFSTETGRLDFGATLSTGADQPTETELVFSAALSGLLPGPAAASLFTAEFDGSLAVINRSAKQSVDRNWDVQFAMAQGEFTLQGGPGDSWHGLIRKDGFFRFDLTSPFPLRGHFEGDIRNDVIDARATGLVMLLPDLNLLINTPFFVIRDGVARGDLAITGPIGDPDFFGLLAVEDLAASSAALADPIAPFDTILEINEKNVRFRDVRTRTGACPINLQAEMILDHWNVSRFTTRIAVTDQAGAHLTLPLDLFSFDGFVTTPGLTITADAAGVSIAGDLFVQNCDVILGQTTKIREDEQADAANLVADLTLKTGKQVEFYWPARELPILRMLSEPGAQLGIKYNKLKNEFALNGDINFKGGNVYYFERNFLIREGSLSLKETQLDFNPILNLKAERKVRYDDKDVKITLTVPNQHLKDFSPVFDSDPPLPITERYLALGGVIQNPGTDQSGEYFSSVVSDIGGDVLTQIVLLRPLEDKVKDLLNLDGFSIRTQFIANLLLDTLFNTETTLPESAAVSMGRYLNNTEISFQKYLDDKNNLFFETIVRFQADTLPSDATALSSSFGNVNVESEFSLELTTPFFLTIKWSITPEHWESFFLPDNRISFKWGISF